MNNITVFCKAVVLKKNLQSKSKKEIRLMYLIVDLIWMRYSPLLRWCIKITTVSFSRKLCPTFWLRSNSISSSSTGNWAWSSNRSSQATTTFVSDEVLCVLNLDSGRLSSESSLPRRDMARFWNQRERLGVDLNDNNPFTATGLVQSVKRLNAGREVTDSIPGTGQAFRVIKYEQ